MIKESIGEIFNFLSETNITEQYSYNHQGEYPVFSGQTEDNGIVAQIDSFNQEEPCLIFTTYGSAGKLSYRDGKFTIGRNAMGLRPKSKYKEQISLQWFSYKFQNLFYRLRIGDPQGQKSLNKLLLNGITITIPDKKLQEKELLYYKKALMLQDEITKIRDELHEFMKSNQSIKPAYKEKIVKIFKTVGGNSGLTEEFIYYNQPTNEDEKIDILSGATKGNNMMGVVNKNSKPYAKKLKIFQAPFIQIVRKGLAGQMKYFDTGVFSANDDIYISQVRNEWKEKINLRWFCYQYQELFFNLVTSKSDNATFNKEYAEAQYIEIPDKKIQDKIVSYLLDYDILLSSMEQMLVEIDELLESEIV